MKTDLFTAIVAAVAGVIVAFLVTNMLLPEISNVSFKVLGSSINASLSNPDEEIFNYRAVNPTVEVYVGDCEKYNENGECVNINTEEAATENTEEVPVETPEETEGENGATD